MHASWLQVRSGRVVRATRYYVLQSAHIRTALRDVAHPSIGRVSGMFVDDSQIADLHVGDVEHRDFKVHVDRADFSSYLRGAGLGQCHLRFHCLLGTSRYFLQCPENLSIASDEFGTGVATAGARNDRARGHGRAFWQGNFDRHVGTKVI